MRQLNAILRHILHLPFKNLTLNACMQMQQFHCSTSHLKHNKLWNLGKINHIALVTPDLDKSAALYRDVLGGRVSNKQPLPEHGVTTVFVELGDTKIELLHPLGEKSPIQSFLERNKSGGMHHICIEVDNIHEAIKDLKAKNIRLLSEGPRTGAHGKPVIFLHPKDCDGVLVELEEA
ncbi:unnamed protein product [Candidula unifasciata]|uniref:Methylmalonyl-CoA epimerase, mitochondrial n=1 Tax=Candidula unifasciata TaxID=100452 RepID=A0A8S4A284_9EUPU|nr:unnamed protein product [Candidula unifasciata]